MNWRSNVIRVSSDFEPFEDAEPLELALVAVASDLTSHAFEFEPFRLDS
jgi:hypothetical protein